MYSFIGVLLGMTVSVFAQYNINSTSTQEFRILWHNNCNADTHFPAEYILQNIVLQDGDRPKVEINDKLLAKFINKQAPDDRRYLISNSIIQKCIAEANERPRGLQLLNLISGIARDYQNRQSVMRDSCEIRRFIDVLFNNLIFSTNHETTVAKGWLQDGTTHYVSIFVGENNLSERALRGLCEDYNLSQTQVEELTRIISTYKSKPNEFQDAEDATKYIKKFNGKSGDNFRDLGLANDLADSILDYMNQTLFIYPQK